MAFDYDRHGYRVADRDPIRDVVYRRIEGLEGRKDGVLLLSWLLCRPTPPSDEIVGLDYDRHGYRVADRDPTRDVVYRRIEAMTADRRQRHRGASTRL